MEIIDSSGILAKTLVLTTRLLCTGSGGYLQKDKTEGSKARKRNIECMVRGIGG